MCIEALNIGGEEKLNRFVQMAKDNQLRISDAMPYIGDTMYLPKPMIRIEGTDKDSALKKNLKNLHIFLFSIWKRIFPEMPNRQA